MLLMTLLAIYNISCLAKHRKFARSLRVFYILALISFILWDVSFFLYYAYDRYYEHAIDLFKGWAIAFFISSTYFYNISKLEELPLSL
jgi:hypothetical protein